MVWLLAIPLIWFAGKYALWLYALDVTLKTHRRMRFSTAPGDIAQFPQIDGSELPQLTAELTALGFTYVCDIVSGMDIEPLPTPVSGPIPEATPPPQPGKFQVDTKTNGVARLFIHPLHGCYATLISVVAVSRFPAEMKRPDMVNVAPFRTVILTLSGNSEGSWGFATHNRELDQFSLLHRHPRQLSHRQVGVRAKQLLESHLRERVEIAERGGFRWDLSPSQASYEEYEARGMRHIKVVLQRLTTPSAVLQLLANKLSKHERWMGELA